MSSIHSFSSLFVVLALASSARSAGAQCLEPTSGLHAAGIVGDALASDRWSAAVFDDGSGPALFIGGRAQATVDSITASNLLKWDGAQWTDLGVADTVLDLAVFDGGNGALLYLALDTFPSTTLATWDGTSVMPLADQPDDNVSWLDVIDLGSGPELYASGFFSQIGSVPAPGIARFDGTSWTAVGNGAGVLGPLEAFDDGSGLKLFGVFRDPPNFTCDPQIMRLDGGGWTSLGVLDDPGICVRINDLHVHDDGSGAKLYVGGFFTLAAGVPVKHVARWNGSAWSAVGALNIAMGTSFFGSRQLLTYDDGSGNALYTVGRILGEGATTTTGIMRWNGSAWQAVGSGLGTRVHSGPIATTNTAEVGALAVFDEGSGSRLFAAGGFENSGSVAAFSIARWNGSQWSSVGSGGQGIGRVVCFEQGDDGNGAALFAGGRFTGAGAVGANHIARFDGTSWSALGQGLSGDVLDIAFYDSGSGPNLYAAGEFREAGPGLSATGIARWDGTQWHAVGTGMLPRISCLQVYDGGIGSRLYAGVSFGGAHVHAWNGSVWSPVGTGTDGEVLTFAVFNGDLYAGGNFTLAGGNPASGLARWNPSAGWSAVGTGGPFGGAKDLVVHDDGTGAALYALQNSGSVIKRWNGSTWTTVPSTPGGTLQLDSLDVGYGRPSLVSLGDPVVPVYRWTGSSWVPLTSDTVDSGANAIASVLDPNACAPKLYVGGTFTRYGSDVSTRFAELSHCDAGTPYCFGDGSLSTPCPCTPPNTVPSPSGAPGHGCANSFNLDGAKLCAIGTVNPDTVVLRVSGQTPAGFTQFFKGNAEIPGGFAIFDGVRCVGGTFIRFGAQNALNGTAFYPNAALGFATPLSAIGGTPVGSGQTGHYQTIYRNVTANFCSAGLLNFSNAVEILWQ